MPRYDFSCGNCGNEFELFLSIKEKETSLIVCPYCSSKKIKQLFTKISFVGKNPDNSLKSCMPDSGCCG